MERVLENRSTNRLAGTIPTADSGLATRFISIHEDLLELRRKLYELNISLRGQKPEDTGKSSAQPSSLMAWTDSIQEQLSACLAEASEANKVVGL
jgi:hypothetical protein